MTFYDRLTSILAYQGIRPSKFMHDMKINSSTFYTWKTRGNTPNNLAVKAIANYLGVPITDLLPELAAMAQPTQEESERDTLAKVLRTITETATTAQIARMIQFWYSEVKDNV